MRPNMNPHDDMKDEEQWASVLGSSEADAAPPDPDFLARLRAQSSEAFAAASSQPAPGAERKRPMFIRQARWFGTIAAVVIVGVGLYFWFAPASSGVTLGEVLDNVEKANTFHARLSGIQPIEFWHTSQPKRSRWDFPNGSYLI